jgi:hypothetical protein
MYTPSAAAFRFVVWLGVFASLSQRSRVYVVRGYHASFLRQCESGRTRRTLLQVVRESKTKRQTTRYKGVGGLIMNSSIENWPRSYYRSGGGDASLFYVVYGPIPQSFSVSGSKYCCDGILEGIDVSSYGPTSKPEAVGTFRSGYLWDEFQRANVKLANDVANQSECLVIRGTISDPSNLNYLRNVVGLIAFALTAAALPFSIHRCLSGGLHPSGGPRYLSRPLPCRLTTS